MMQVPAMGGCVSDHRLGKVDLFVCVQTIEQALFVKAPVSVGLLLEAGINHG